MHKGPRRPLLTAAQLAELHDVDGRTIRRWARAGCPVVKRGKAGHRAPVFDAAAVEVWVERNAGNERALVGAFCSKLDAQARAAVRVLERLEAETIPREDVVDGWNAVVRMVRGRLERWPAEFTQRLVAEMGDQIPDGEAMRRRLEAEVRLALVGLATAPIEWEPKRPREPWPPPRRHVKTSATIREARSQLAGFQAAVLDVRERIAAGREWLAANGGRWGTALRELQA